VLPPVQGLARAAQVRFVRGDCVRALPAGQVPTCAPAPIPHSDDKCARESTVESSWTLFSQCCAPGGGGRDEMGDVQLSSTSSTRRRRNRRRAAVSPATEEDLSRLTTTDDDLRRPAALSHDAQSALFYLPSSTASEDGG